jgi:uncharacterized membrane protein YhaH (DUF805 family)
VLTAQLRGRDPPLDQKDFDRECLALENAINRIEQEINSINQIEQPLAAPQINAETETQSPPQRFSAPVSTGVADQAKISPSKKILTVLSNIAMGGAGLLMMVLFAIIPTALVLGGALIADKVLHYLVWPVVIVFLLCVVIFLPLSVFRETRTVSAIGFMISSYVFGASAWFAGLLGSYTYFGLVGTVLALCFFGFGVVPVGIIGALVHSDWMAAGLLFGGLILTFGTRAMAAWMVVKVENDQRTYRPPQPDSAVIRALKYFFSFSGRFNRANFWIVYGIAFLMTVVPPAVIEIIFPDNSAINAVVGVWCILWFVSIQAVAARRLHDLGYSGLWLLAYFAVYVAAYAALDRDFGMLTLLVIICLGVVPGNKGANRFGGEPPSSGGLPTIGDRELVPQ